MPATTPNFWFKPVATTQARLLYPLSLLYGLAGKLRRLMVPAIDCPVPLIVAGNAVVGGSGKTPLVIYLVHKLKALHPDLKIALIGKGYGGKEIGPLQVDPVRHTADQVGDEALLLAKLAPTFIGRDRGKTYQAAVATGAQLVISDDGLQNPALDKATLRFLVIGSRRGIGNGLLLPAGPLRETISEAASRAHAIIQVGGESGRNWTSSTNNSLPVYHAHFVQDHPAWLKGMTTAAFCGLGDPERFFFALKDAGANLQAALVYPDHHPYSAADLAQLERTAFRHNATLITTAKDAVRLPQDWVTAQGDRLKVLDGQLNFVDEPAFLSLLYTAIPSLKPK